MDALNQKTNFGKLLPILLGCFVMGFVDIVGAAIGHVKEDFNLTESVANFIPSMVFLWFFFISVPTGWLQAKIGKRKASILGIGITALGMFLPIIHYSFPIVLLGFTFLGIGNTIVQVSLNPLIMYVTSPKQYPSYLNLSQFIKAISSFLGPIVVTYFAKEFGDWKLMFLVFGITSIISALWLWFNTIDEPMEQKERTTFASIFAILNNKVVLGAVLGIFLVVGLDVGMNTGVRPFLMSRFNISNDEATPLISLYFGGRIIGTFVAAMVLRALSANKFFFLTSIIAVLGLIGMYFSTDPMIVKIMIGVVGFGGASIWGLIYSITIVRMQDKANELSALMIMAVSGGAVIPPIMGYMNDKIGANGNIIVLAVCAIYLLGLASVSVRKSA